jgi:hypothetical protein
MESQQQQRMHKGEPPPAPRAGPRTCACVDRTSSRENSVHEHLDYSSASTYSSSVCNNRYDNEFMPCLRAALNSAGLLHLVGTGTAKGLTPLHSNAVHQRDAVYLQMHHIGVGRLAERKDINVKYKTSIEHKNTRVRYLLVQRLMARNIASLDVSGRQRTSTSSSNCSERCC